MNDSVIDWLLETNNPPVRLLTLQHLLDRSEDDVDVLATKAQLMDYAVTQNILSHMDEIWASTKFMFWSYKGKHWNTVYLGQFLADGHDPRIAAGVDPMLAHPWQSDKWFCMTACMLTAFQRLGYSEHPNVVQSIEILAQRLLDGNGLHCVGMNISLMPYCYMTLPKVLLCFAEVPEEKRTTAVQQAITWMVDEIIKHNVYVYLPGNRKQWDAVRPRSRKKADVPEGETPDTWREKMKAQFIAEHGMGALEPKTAWKRFGYPTNYNSDILEMMYALARVKAPMHPAFEDALQLILDKRTEQGTWLLDRSFNGQMWADVEIKKQSSKWITYQAMFVLKHFGISD